MWLLAGRNGAAKSTYAENLEGRVARIVRPDELASRISRYAPETVALAAGRSAVRLLQEFIDRRASFAVETTLAGKLHLRIAEKAKDDGWRIGLVYIGLTNADLAIARVKERVSNGGHHVPPRDVRRRYERSLYNVSFMLKLADRAILLDNSSTRFPMKLVAEAAGGQFRLRIRRLPLWLRAPLNAPSPFRRS